jgi:hypothetical protein
VQVITHRSQFRRNGEAGDDIDLVAFDQSPDMRLRLIRIPSRIGWLQLQLTTSSSVAQLVECELHPLDVAPTGRCQIPRLSDHDTDLEGGCRPRDGRRGSDLRSR